MNKSLSSLRWNYVDSHSFTHGVSISFICRIFTQKRHSFLCECYADDNMKWNVIKKMRLLWRFRSVHVTEFSNRTNHLSLLAVFGLIEIICFFSLFFVVVTPKQTNCGIFGCFRNRFYLLVDFSFSQFFISFFYFTENSLPFSISFDNG